MIVEICLKDLATAGRNFNWERPSVCSRCGNFRIWGHGFVKKYQEGFKDAVLLKRYRCPDCVSSAGKKLGQSTLSYLRPPKIRTKGRFQNLSYIAKWAELMLEIFDAENSPLELDQMKKIRRFHPSFSQFKPFLAKFILSLRVALDVQQILKKNGLNRSTYQACMDLIEPLPSRSKLRARLKSWLQRHLSIQCQLGIGQTPIPVSTDVLESLFGKFGVIVARNPKAQFNRIVLTMPAICGDVSEDYIDLCLQETSHLDLKEWEKNHVKNSNSRKRRKLKLNLSRSKNCPSLVA